MFEVTPALAGARVEHPARLAECAASKSTALAMKGLLAEELKGRVFWAAAVLLSIIDTEVCRSAKPGADFTKCQKRENIARLMLVLARAAKPETFNERQYWFMVVSEVFPLTL